MVSLIQHFEADFLWKVGLRILNSGIILKTKLSPMLINHSSYQDLVLLVWFQRKFCKTQMFVVVFCLI